MAFTAEQFKAIASNLGDVAGALGTFEQNTPGSSTMTLQDAAAVLANDNLNAILAAQPNFGPLKLPDVINQLTILSNQLENAAVSQALANIQGNVQGLVDGTAAANAAVAVINRVEKVVGIALAVLALATSVAAAVAAPTPASVEAAISSATALKSAIDPPPAAGAGGNPTRAN